MGTFAASLKTLGDRQGLPATVRVGDGQIRIDAGESPIGSWSLDDVNLEPTSTGFRMAAEGEQIFIELTDTEAFESELNAKSGRKFTFPAKDQILIPVDKSLVMAKKRWGALLPDWVFTRIMAGVGLGALILMIIFPTWVSSFLLLAGLLTVMFGAVVYMDGILASKWLPGRMAPMHVLLFGVSVVVFGVLLGVLAR